MEDEWWDLNAVVRSCGASAASWLPATRDPFSSFPLLAPPALVKVEEKEPAGGGGGSYLGFQDVLESGRGGGFQELEEFFRPLVPGAQKRTPAHRGSTSPPVAALTAALATTAVAGPHQPPPLALPAPAGMAKPAQRSLSHVPRSKRRKNQQKKVVCHVPADGLSSDMWAWRKYGQKPIKGSPYPRGYYRCSSSKGCLARKQVERSRVDPAMFIITYTAEHNHPMPTHRNSLAGITRHKFPPSSSSAGASAAAAASASASAGDSSGDNPPSAPGNPAASPLSSSTAAGLSPTTPLTASMEDELLRGHPPGSAKEEDAPGDEEDEDDDVLLSVDDMEVMGEDDLLFMAPDEVMGGGAARSAAAFFEDDAGYGDHFFAPSPWLSSTGGGNAAAAAGGS